MERARKLAQQRRHLIAGCSEPADVAAGAEQPPRAGQHDTADCGVGLAADRQLDERPRHRQIHGVAGVPDG